MKNTQAYIAAIPVALFIAIESVTILLFGPSTTFWIESAFSLVMLALVVSTLLFGPQKNLKIIWYLKDTCYWRIVCSPIVARHTRVRVKNRGASSNSNSQFSASKRCDSHALRNRRFRISRIYH